MGPVLLLAVLSGLFWRVSWPFPLGVAEVNRTYCCGDPKLRVDVDRWCENRFIVGDKTVALVNGTDVQTVQGLFKFHKYDGTMEVLECVSFSLWSFCELDGTFVRERIYNYDPTACAQADL